LAALIASVVGHVMGDPDRAALAARDPLAGGVLALAEGAMLLSATDDECLERSFPLYDALYARLIAQLEIERHVPQPAASVLAQTLQIAHGVDRLRQSGQPFSHESFADALRANPEPRGVPAGNGRSAASMQSQGGNGS
jgi:hypothetical protein